VKVSDGRRTVYDTKRHTVRIPAIPASARVSIQVAGRDSSGRRGRSGIARVSRARVKRR
jgi:hypothetical protein